MYESLHIFKVGCCNEEILIQFKVDLDKKIDSIDSKVDK